MSGIQSFKASVIPRKTGISPVLPNSIASLGQEVKFTVKPANKLRTS